MKSGTALHQTIHKRDREPTLYRCKQAESATVGAQQRNLVRDEVPVWSVI
jgi:nucleoside-triphosphatase THEP1